jgi:hypothetical protein
MFGRNSPTEPANLPPHPAPVSLEREQRLSATASDAVGFPAVSNLAPIQDPQRYQRSGLEPSGVFFDSTVLLVHADVAITATEELRAQIEPAF